jgi:hypothetical protein
MQQTQGGILNRIGTKYVLNWQFIESIEFDEIGKFTIYYTSGRFQEFSDREIYSSMLQTCGLFPDITDPQVREQMANASRPNKKELKREERVKTDIVQ